MAGNNGRKKIDAAELVKFLAKGRTLEEVSRKFSIPPNKVAELVLKAPEGFEIFRQRNSFNEVILRALEIPKAPEIKPRLWSHRIQPDGQPYLWVHFPDGLPWEKIKVVPLFDTHYGSEGCDEEKLDEYIDWIRKNDNVFAFMGGDMVENAHADSPGTSIFHQVMRPKRQILKFEDKLRPIAHKILFGLPGGHEFRSIKKVDIDPLWIICRDLGIPYFSQPAFVNIIWNSFVFNFYIHHGETHSSTPGGRLNAAIKPASFTEFIMFYVMGHVHDEDVNPVTRICRERKFSKEGKLVEFRLVEKQQYIIIAPAFYKYWGTYGAERGYAPPSTGAVACVLYANGNYDVSI